nr:hypothetical protein [Tanacetum cinerariifolium]
MTPSPPSPATPPPWPHSAAAVLLSQPPSHQSSLPHHSTINIHPHHPRGLSAAKPPSWWQPDDGTPPQPHLVVSSYDGATPWGALIFDLLPSSFIYKLLYFKFQNMATTKGGGSLESERHIGTHEKFAEDPPKKTYDHTLCGNVPVERPHSLVAAQGLASKFDSMGWGAIPTSVPTAASPDACAFFINTTAVVLGVLPPLPPPDKSKEDLLLILKLLLLI